MEMYGIPVGYMPYFWHADPSVKRASGLLIPSMGASSHIGAFFAQPYYWVIDDQSDATFTPMMTTRAGPQLDVEYRRQFNNGHLLLDGSVGYPDHSVQGTIYAQGQFSLDDTWRWGFNIARASSADYIRDFHLAGRLGTDANVLTSQIYGEGFGQGAYSRFDVRFYQSLNDTIISSKLPVVLPRYEYSYFGLPDSLGGRLSLDANAFNVMRTDGTNTRRAALTVELVAAVRRRTRRSVEDHAAQRRDRLRCECISTSSRTSARRARSTRRAPSRRRRWISAGRSCGTPAHGARSSSSRSRRSSSGRRPATARTPSIRTRTASTWNSPTPICSASTASPASTGWTAACARMSRCTAPGISAAPPSMA